MDEIIRLYSKGSEATSEITQLATSAGSTDVIGMIITIVVVVAVGALAVWLIRKLL